MGIWEHVPTRGAVFGAPTRERMSPQGMSSMLFCSSLMSVDLWLPFSYKKSGKWATWRCWRGMERGEGVSAFLDVNFKDDKALELMGLLLGTCCSSIDRG